MNGMDILVINIINEVLLILKYWELFELILKVYLIRGIIVIFMVLIIFFLNGFVMFLFLMDLKRCFCFFLSCFFVVSLVLVDFMVGGFLEFIDVYYSFVIVFGW